MSTGTLRTHAVDDPRVLVVDDAPEILLSIKRVFRGAAISVSTANSAAAALGLIARETFDVLLIDIQMPGVTGDHLAERLAVELPDVPCIIITGAPTADALQRLESLPNVVATVSKPVDSEALAMMLHEMCRCSPDLRKDFAHWRDYLRRGKFKILTPGSPFAAQTVR